MNILITGVAGLLGANFSKYMLDRGHTVIGIDNLSGGFKSFIDSRVDFYEADLSDWNTVDQIFHKTKPDYVYHFAAYAAEGLSPYIRRFNYTNNVVCSMNIINACINFNVKKLIFTSSMAVYGKGDPPYTEDQMLFPEDPYGIAKYAVESDIKLAHSHFGLPYSIVRPHNVVGLYQNIWDRYRNVIGIWIRQAMKKEDLTIFGDGTQVRAFSDIKFCMSPFEVLMKDHSGEVFNIGADKHWTINDAAKVVQKVASRFGDNVNLIHLEKRSEVHTAYPDHKKAKQLLNFNDRTDLESVITEMYSWARAQPERKVKNCPYEIEKNIYSFWKV